MGSVRMKIRTVDFVFSGLAAASALLCWVLVGLPGVIRGLGEALNLLLVILPQLGAGLLIGGLVQQFVDRERVAAMLGQNSGMKGLGLATVAGMLTPGGPFASFPLVYALWVSGADAGALIAFITAWSLIGLNRLVIWELPFMGADFALLRFFVSLPAPIVAGLLARWIVQATPLKMREAPRA